MARQWIPVTPPRPRISLRPQIPLRRTPVTPACSLPGCLSQRHGYVHTHLSAV